MTKQEGQQQITRLIEKYKKLTPAARKGYNESMTCKDLILPLFQALGWDVYNNFSNNEVSSETQVSGKRVDYSFHLNNITKFFLEAKKIDVDLKEERWAEQAVMYAWHKSVPWAILTDFESIKVFNAEWDEPNIERSIIFEISYKNYLTDERLWLLSKQSMKIGELDKYAAENFQKPKREPVDKQLSADLVNWREILFENLKGYNEGKLLTDKQLSEAVQRMLDRLIFIRTTEDKGIENKYLQELGRIYKENKKGFSLTEELKKLFKNYDEWYNSKLFQNHICDVLEYEDSFLADVIKELYKNKKGTRYDFASINADVLGSIYEQYLGQIQKENGKEKKSSKRKSQGIYYTPRYIVDYIIQNTLGEVLKNKPAHEAMKIKVLDPACGSGSFLIKTFEVLDEHIKREWHQKGTDSTINYARKLPILTSSIYGVDLDAEAVEIAQLNLLLKTLERRECLPNLMHNIECGNSLISGTEAELKKHFGDNWKDKKPFDWKEKFKDVFGQGGFDVIIGNPPYIKEFVDKSAFDGLHNNPYYQGKMDIWTLFGCVAVDLLKEGGLFSFIAPNNWLTNVGASIFRNKILSEGEIINFIDFGDFKVFDEAGIQTMIFVFRKTKPREVYDINYSKIIDKNIIKEDLIKFLNSDKNLEIQGIQNFKIQFKPKEFLNKLISFVGSDKEDILKKIEAKRNFELQDEEISNGIHHHHDTVNKERQKILGDNFHIGEGIFVLSDAEKENISFTKKELEIIKPSYTTDEIKRWYADSHNKEWVIYTDSSFKDLNKIESYPNIKKHLDKFNKVITSDNGPYGLHRAKKENFFIGEKIIVLRKCTIPTFTYVNFDSYVSATFYIIKTNRIDQKYLTAILNSSLIAFWLKNKGKMQGNNYQLDKAPLMNIPIYISDKNQQKIIIDLVEKITEQNKKLKKFDPILDEEEYKELKIEIDKIDKEIDKKIYELYGLTEKDIKIVESL